MLAIKVVSLLLSALLVTAVPQKHTHLHARAVNSSTQYDYVVIGSGPGGGPLASRLAIAGHKVLLIEAGDDQGNSTDQMVPALQLQSTEYTPQKWDYFVQHYVSQERQEQDSKMVWNTTSGELYTGKTPPSDATPLGVLYPRAGTLGGCSAHNAMITVLPFDNDWTYIQNLTGDDTWAPDNMRDYFIKLEKNEYLPSSIVGHGFDGWLHTSLTSLLLVIKDEKLLSLVISAATALGKSLLSSLLTTVTGLAHILTDDLNSVGAWRDSTQNLYQVPIAVNDESLKRSGPRDFILSVANAVNSDGSRKYHLDIKLNTLATRVRFEDNGTEPKAVGVEYITGQSLYAADPRFANASGIAGYVAAGKEVIVSTGAFNTPQLLKLSGVGPKDELESFGIDVVKDLPGVGTNLQDRYETGVIGKNPGEFVITKDCTFGYTSPDPCLEQWQSGETKSDKGTYATNGIAVAVTKRSTTAAGEDPDLFISGAPVQFKGYYPDYARVGLSDANHWTWIILKAHARNTAGTVKLRSTDPRDTPEITFNSFDTGSGEWEDDLQAVYEAMEWARQAYDDLFPLDGKFTEVWPGTNVTGDSLKQFIKDEAWGHHASCTCPIGSDDDANAVLDSNFRVRGVSGLRVVDASIFPKIPGYYIALPVYMISEKAADVIINGS
ncbi:hypothetical protein DOTSEDRAFT_71706 [Dothistroma septosporum NZE10]|uniref:Glucose-methanol-choline oxidoreductase N-terminal domain-containing protein n=1 Tax=Dothistroma septosporum (strain NZE10 / CBS 128990) TaxID=675120 RepID=N1PLU3_DOTSN|nr:hypothetical protein DOTSEDRAFT_71706 [Dothistroma septosporum NZE10]